MHREFFTGAKLASFSNQIQPKPTNGGHSNYVKDVDPITGDTAGDEELGYYLALSTDDSALIIVASARGVWWVIEQ